MTQNSWYVVTGGPSVGKTTLLAALAAKGYATAGEAARAVIDEGLAAGKTVAEIRADEKAFQEEVVRYKIATEATLPKDVPTFFDRAMHDTIAYLRYYGFGIADWIREACRQSRYATVFLLEPLATYEQDYARVEDADFARKIQDLLYDAYAEDGMQPVRVPAMPSEDRVQFILNHVSQEQPS